ncbi:MAG TPA: hypothetical protein DCS93_23460 [Microscillaceae bacterium]|nr:hypothetical protein [Microscillaceae bacterium]
MSLNKLTLTKFHYSVKGTPVKDHKNEMEVMINPAEINNKLNVQYEKQITPGTIKPQLKFVGKDNETLDFKLYFDGTGLIPPPKKVKTSTSAETESLNVVEQQIEKLKKIVAGYDGAQHEVNYVFVKWANLKMHCRLTSMSIKYTLFDTDGRPLRAQVALSFQETTNPKEETLIKNNNSPDMSHIKTIQAGYGLRHMCYEIYGDGRLDVVVARFNDFPTRYMPVGTEVILPPLKRLN